MCRLLGIYGQVDNLYELLMEFQELAEFGNRPGVRGHVDGWGMAMSSPDCTQMAQVERQVGSAYQSPVYETAVNNLLESPPRIVLAHLRQASYGISCTLPNTQPFFYSIEETTWAFIHNGTIYDPNSLERDDSYPLTSDGSDTEVLFHHIMTQLKVPHGTTPPDRFRQIVDVFSSLSVRFSAVNSLLSNGSEFYAIRWANVNLSYYTLYYSKLPSAVVICSEPILNDNIDPESWKIIPNHAVLRVYDDPPKIHIIVV